MEYRERGNEKLMKRPVCVDNINAKRHIEDSFKSFMSKYFSRGPGVVKGYIIEDVVLVYCEDFLTTLEKNLAKDEIGQCYVQIIRKKISDEYGDFLVDMIETSVGQDVKAFYLDCNVANNSLCCVFMLNEATEVC